MQKARSVIPNMCWYLAKALLPIGKKTRAIENVALARRVSARTPSTTEIPREDNGARDGRMDSHGHPNGDPTPMRKGRPSGRPFFTLERSLHVKRTLFLDLVCVIGRCIRIEGFPPGLAISCGSIRHPDRGTVHHCLEASGIVIRNAGAY